MGIINGYGTYSRITQAKDSSGNLYELVNSNVAKMICKVYYSKPYEYVMPYNTQCTLKNINNGLENFQVSSTYNGLENSQIIYNNISTQTTTFTALGDVQAGSLITISNPVDGSGEIETCLVNGVSYSISEKAYCYKVIIPISSEAETTTKYSTSGQLVTTNTNITKATTIYVPVNTTIIVTSTDAAGNETTKTLSLT